MSDPRSRAPRGVGVEADRDAVSPSALRLSGGEFGMGVFVLDEPLRAASPPVKDRFVDGPRPEARSGMRDASGGAR